MYDVYSLLNWVSESTGIMNVLSTLADAGYFGGFGGEPYNASLLIYRENRFFYVGSLVLPFLAMISIHYRKDKLILIAAVLLIVFTVLSMGAHYPFDEIFYWMIDNIPAFWIFRAPWQKFGNIYIFAYSILLGITFSRIFQFLGRKKKRPLDV